MPFTAESYYRDDEHAEPVIIATATAADVDVMIDDLLAQPPGHNFATVYIRERPLDPHGLPDHELGIGVDADSGTGVLVYTGSGRGGAASSVTHNPDATRARPNRYCHYYIEQKLPAGCDIPLADVRRATHQFLTSGGHRPDCVQWQPHPSYAGS